MPKIKLIQIGLSKSYSEMHPNRGNMDQNAIFLLLFVRETG